MAACYVIAALLLAAFFAACALAGGRFRAPACPVCQRTDSALAVDEFAEPGERVCAACGWRWIGDDEE